MTYKSRQSGEPENARTRLLPDGRKGDCVRSWIRTMETRVIPEDYSPAESPSVEQQRDALRKGLGRAMQWARKGQLADEPLLTACLENQVFDTQCEDPRGDWLWKLIETTETAQRFRGPILDALDHLPDERSAPQLCAIARHYAKRRDVAFRSRLYEIVEQRPFVTFPYLAEKEILELDGEQALVFAARIRGAELAHREWDWDDRFFIRRVSSRFGEDIVHRGLRSSDEHIVRFWNA